MKNLQFFDDPDDVPEINENITIHVGVDGSDSENNGSADAPFRTLGKAIDVIRNKIIGKEKKVTIQLGEIKTSRTGGLKKYFEEEDITIDFESAKRLKIKGVKASDHEVVGISYYDKCSDREGYYCQVIVTNQDKIAIGDYIGIYDHLKIKKRNPSYYWAVDNVGTKMNRLVTPGNCYAEAIRGDMILGVHEVVDVGQPIKHDSPATSTVSTELFSAEEVQVGTVTLHIKNDNYTYQRLNEVPFYNTLGTVGGKPIWTYAAGSPTSPLKNTGTRYLPMVFYGADDNSLYQPDEIDSENRQDFYFTSAVSQIEIVDIMTRGFGFDLSPLNNKVVDPRTRKTARDTNALWNDKTLTGYNRSIVANPIATYFYKKMADDLRVSDDLAYYFGRTNNPFVTIESIVSAAKKIRDYLLAGASRLTGVPPWDEDNHPGYGFGPFESGAVRNPIGGGAEIDKTSYPPEYADSTKESLLLRFYNIYPPINGQMYQPTLIRRIETFYNDYGESAGGRLTGTNVGLELEQWDAVGNQSPFFCGYITPQGWYKQNYICTFTGGLGEDIPSLNRLEYTGGYHTLFGVDYPIYAGNSATPFNGVVHGSVGTISNDRRGTGRLYYVDRNAYYNETLGITTATGGTASGGEKGSMGTQWYSGSVNNMSVGFNGNGNGGPNIGLLGTKILDKYSFGYANGSPTGANDGVRSLSQPIVQDSGYDAVYLRGGQSMNLRAKCFKSVLRFNGTGIRVKSKTKLALLKDICLVNINKRRNKRTYGIVADEESTINASNIAVSSFSCGVSARNQSLVNLLAELGNSTNPYHRDMMLPVDPAAILTANDIGVESSLKSHVNAQRSVSTGSRLANYLSIANSSIDCSNSASICGFKHGFVADFNSYMKATNCFSEFNGGVGFSTANNSILVAHRSRALWNGNHGLLAKVKSNARCYEFISRSNGGDGIVAQTKSTISCGANSPAFGNYRQSLLENEFGTYPGSDYYGILSTLPPHLFSIEISSPIDAPPSLPKYGKTVNSNPSHGIFIMFHECNSTISEFNCGSGFASESDSMLVADNTISRYNSKKYGEFAVYGWSGIRSSYMTDSFIPSQRGVNTQ